MDLHRLQYFLQVVHDKSISAAAKSLNISQPSLSVHIQSLESELGVALFHREKKRLTLTPAGTVLASKATELLNLNAKITTEIQSFSNDSSSDIWIGGIESHLVSLFIKEITAYEKKHPGIRVHFFSNGENQIIEQLSHNQIDFAILRNIPNNQTAYEYLAIPGEDIWGIICLKTHPFAAKTAITPEELAHERIIIGEEACRLVLNPWMKKYKENLEIVGTGNLAHNCIYLVEEGFGVMVQSKDWVQINDDDIYTFVPFSPILSTKMYLVWNRYPPVSPLVSKIVQIIRDSWAANQTK